MLQAIVLPSRLVHRHVLSSRRCMQSSAGQLTAKLRRCHCASDVISLVRTAVDSQMLDGILWAAAMQRMSIVEKGREEKEEKEDRKYDKAEVRQGQQCVRQGWELLMGMGTTYLPHVGHRELAVVAVAVSKSAKTSKRDKRYQGGNGRRCFLSSVIRTALSASESISVRHLANLAWSAATMQVAADELFEAAASAVAVQRCNARDSSQLLWAFGRSSHKLGVEVLETLAGRHMSPRMFPTFGDHDIAATIWGVATLAALREPKDKGRQFIKEFTAHAAGRSSEFSPQGLSMLFWGTATLVSKGVDMPSSVLIRACAPQVVKLAPRFTTQGAANILWSLSTLARVEQDGVREASSFEDVGSLSSDAGRS
ncbi:unnamed protein product [Symbiodinium natans]|uniref:Uncharacterized protein n=1 Tax=Symbiodinium natans TaxID=878477 RepID=A0A812GLB1_9DINO|nr:unnamed protein product [Symbiodinium natans]